MHRFSGTHRHRKGASRTYDVKLDEGESSTPEKKYSAVDIWGRIEKARSKSASAIRLLSIAKAYLTLTSDSLLWEGKMAEENQLLLVQLVVHAWVS